MRTVSEWLQTVLLAASVMYPTKISFVLSPLADLHTDSNFNLSNLKLDNQCIPSHNTHNHNMLIRQLQLSHWAMGIV